MGWQPAQAGPVCPFRDPDALQSRDRAGHHGNVEHGRSMQIWFEAIDVMDLYLETKGKESTCDPLRNNSEALQRDLEIIDSFLRDLRNTSVKVME